MEQQPDKGRRDFLKGALVGGAVVAGGAVAKDYLSKGPDTHVVEAQGYDLDEVSLKFVEDLIKTVKENPTKMLAYGNHFERAEEQYLQQYADTRKKGQRSDAIDLEALVMAMQAAYVVDKEDVVLTSINDHLMKRLRKIQEA